MAGAGWPVAASERLRQETLDRFLDVLEATAAFMDATARLEQADASGTPDYGNLLVSEAYVRFLREHLSEEAVGSFVTTFHAMGPALRDLLHASPAERIARAAQLREVARRFRGFTGRGP